MRSLTTTIAILLTLSAPAFAGDAKPDDAKPADTTATKPADTTATKPADTTATKPADTKPADPGTGGDRLQKLQKRIEAVRARAQDVRSRIDMLKQAVLGGGVGARATITHENKMGGSFRLIKLVYALDGAQIFNQADDTGATGLGDQKHFDILTGPISPGNHTLSVVIIYRGQGYGVFEYLKQYTFTVKSTYTVAVTEGKQTQVTVIGYEKGGRTTRLENRPAVDFKVSYIEGMSVPKNP
jgi:hypothetical protein